MMPHDPSPWGDVTHARLVCEPLTVLSRKQHVVRTVELHDKAQAHNVRGREMFSGSSREFGQRNNTKQREKSETTGRIKGKMAGWKEGKECEGRRYRGKEKE